MTTPNSPPGDPSTDFDRQLRRINRRSFAIAGATALAGFAAWKLAGSKLRKGHTPWPLRRVLEFNEKVAGSAFNPGRLSRPFDPSLARMPRVNGQYGIDPDPDLDALLLVEGPRWSFSYPLATIKALPKFEVTTELRCIEGWSEVVTWGGARFVDLAALSGLAVRSRKPGNPLANPADLLPYVELKTPDEGYFVGLDIASALHPQTLLCYEMNGQPLTVAHGAPLRLAIPVKYGIKSIKQLGSIRFTETRPPDYWAAKGYDWYAGL